MELYFLDDGSLIIDSSKSTKRIPPDQFEVVRTIGCHRFSGLSGKEAYDILRANELRNRYDASADREDKRRVKENK